MTFRCDYCGAVYCKQSKKSKTTTEAAFPFPLFLPQRSAERFVVVRICRRLFYNKNKHLPSKYRPLGTLVIISICITAMKVNNLRGWDKIHVTVLWRRYATLLDTVTQYVQLHYTCSTTNKTWWNMGGALRNRTVHT